jgi:hypothetical protein
VQVLRIHSTSLGLRIPDDPLINPDIRRLIIEEEQRGDDRKLPNRLLVVQGKGPITDFLLMFSLSRLTGRLSTWYHRTHITCTY